MHIRVTAPYDWTPPLKRQLTFVRTPDPQWISVKHDEGAFAIAAGKAELVWKPKAEPEHGGDA